MTKMISRQTFVRAALGLGSTLVPGVAALASPGAEGGGLLWRRRVLIGFGTTLSLQAGHADAARLGIALDAAVAAIRRIEAEMSLFDPDSALARLNRDGRLRQAPQGLLAVLRIARAVSARSEGAFDVTVQPLWETFSAAQRTGRLPDARAVAAARVLVDWRALTFDHDTLRFERPGMAATLNGIAQGYAADRVRSVLRSHGVRHALIDTGEFAPLGQNSSHAAWTLGVADPRRADTLIARVQSDGRCIASSADNQTHFSDDLRHHHIFDPHTGWSPPALAAVTVLAPSAALADALTKVMFVAGPRRIPALAAAWGVDALWVDKQGRWQATAGLMADMV